jgi:hypothetical protein
MPESTHVECYSGSRYAERPVSFRFLGQEHSVEDVIETWRSPSGLHFRVRTEEEECFELTYDQRADVWSILRLEEEKPSNHKRGAS